MRTVNGFRMHNDRKLKIKLGLNSDTCLAALIAVTFSVFHPPLVLSIRHVCSPLHHRAHVTVLQSEGFQPYSTWLCAINYSVLSYGNFCALTETLSLNYGKQ